MNGRIAARAAGGAALAAVLVLSGCVAEPAPAPAPTTSSASPVLTPSPTPTESPGPGAGTPTPGAEPSWPAYDPADPSTWTIDFSGIGPFTLGESLEEQAAAFDGIPFDDCGNSAVASYSSPGVWFAASRSGDDSGDVVLVYATTSQDQPGTPGPHTTAGIRSGDSIGALLAAYPGIRAHMGALSPHYFLTDGSTWINFSVFGRDSVEEIQPTDTIGGISVTYQETPPKEICG